MMADRNPMVTVLMPVYNGEKYLKESITSILGQTYGNFEFIIINDGSTDSSAKIIRSYNDQRIKFIDNQKNAGLAAVLNQGIKLAAGEYIVRMDADDISLPARIKKQVEFMNRHSEIGVAGTWVKFLDSSCQPLRSVVCKYPVKPREVKAGSLFNSSFAHPSVIMRKSLLERFRLGYDPEHTDAEDYGLWQKCSFCFPLANIPEVLLIYRVHPGNITNSDKNIEFEAVRRINRQGIQNLGVDFSPAELFIYKNHPIDFKPEFLSQFHAWLQRLQQANLLKELYPEPEFSRALSGEWFWACYRSCALGSQVWFLFWRLPLSQGFKFDAKLIVKFFLKSVLKKPCGNLN